MTVIPYRSVYQDGANSSAAQKHSFFYCSTAAELPSGTQGDIGYAANTNRLYQCGGGATWYRICLTDYDIPAAWNGGTVTNNINIQRWPATFAAGYYPGQYASARLTSLPNDHAGLSFNLKIDDVSGAYSRDFGGLFGTLLKQSGVYPGEGPQLRWFNDVTGSLLEKWRVGQYGEIYERGRTVAQGEWITPPYSSGNFGNPTAGAAWSVDNEDRWTDSYMLVGKALTWNLYLANTAIGGGSPSGPEIRATIPGGFYSTNYYSNVCRLYLSTTGWELGFMATYGAVNYVTIGRLNGTNFPVCSLWVVGQLTFSIQ